jgi:hypothetical protein
MAGAQPDHVSIEGNIFEELFQQLRGKDCRPLGSNQAVRLAASKGYVFPDITHSSLWEAGVYDESRHRLPVKSRSRG